MNAPWLARMRARWIDAKAFFGGLLIALTLAACQPASATPALPTRAYSGPPVQTATLAMKTAVTIAASPQPTDHPPALASPEQTTPALTAPAAPTKTSNQLPSPALSPSLTPIPSISPSPSTEPPTQPSLTPTPPPPVREQIGEIPSAAGPVPIYFPAPGDALESWESLSGAAQPADLAWKACSFPLEIGLPDTPANATFRCPTQWTVAATTSTRRISLLDSTTPSEKIALDILYQASRPYVESQQSGDFQVHPVEIAGDPALLIVYTQDPEKQQRLTVIFQHQQAWYIAAAAIQRDLADPAQMDRFRTSLFALFQSLRINP